MNEMIQLLNSALKGDSRAYDRLYEMTHQKAYYAALKYMKDEHQAEDVLQEAYIKAFNNLNTLQNANKFEAWLHKIIYTTAMDVYRKRKRQTEHSINFSDYEGENETSVEFEDDREEFKPEEQIDYQETQKAVLNFIDELSSPQRMAMVLFYYEQYSLKEIADVMECSVGTVKSRLNKAKQLMRGMVDGYEKKHGVALHALPLFPFLAWAFKKAADTSTVHAAPLAYTATAAKKITQQQIKQKTVEKSVAQKAAGLKLGAASTAKKAAVVAQKAVVKKVIIGIVAAGAAGGTVFGANHYIQQKQQARIESQQAAKSVKTIKQKKETKTERQMRLEAYVKYLEDMDEDTRFYIADIAENQNPVLLIGHLYDNSNGNIGTEETKGNDFYDSYAIYGYENGNVINISEDEDAGLGRGIQLAKKGKDYYINFGYSTSNDLTAVRDNKIYRYSITRKVWKGDSKLYKGNETIKDWSGASQEEIDQLLDSFEIDYDHNIQFYKNTKENRDKYCK